MIFLMDLPSPVHGMSNVNKAINDFSSDNGLKHTTINTVPSYAVKYYPGSFWTIVKLIHTIYCLIKLVVSFLSDESKSLYRPINGGSGQVFDLIYFCIARIFTKKIYIHHHSFAYLNKYSRLFNALNKLSGKHSIHIVLGEKMKELLVDLYNIDAKRIVVLSNLAFFETHDIDINKPKSNLTLGHLANLCKEKGVDVFIGVCQKLHDLNVPFNAKIAGPFVDEETQKFVSEALKLIPELEYLGPLYGDDKESFYRELDCFIFPSKYVNEAEPLVLYEAAVYGTYLIGSRRGCMESVIKNLYGFSVPESEQMEVRIADKICEEINLGGFDIKSSEMRKTALHQESQRFKARLTTLIDDMKRHEKLPES
ncbi:glycosyltransferase family 4 protein [Paraglaciecola sp. 2405UD69-4]|uniref:glycosyltransferase family 4 protein n=1 Tax=Paraglaciecola sp. 2405UD69-4 TaxID=3391836 RepID=UPI0039C8FA6B